MNKVLAVAIGLSFTVIAFANSTGNNLIQTISKGKLKVIKNFETPFGLTGHVAQSKNSHQKMIVYTDKSEKYLIVGYVVNAQGINYTKQYTNKYVISPMASTAYQKLLTNTHWFTDGQVNAPHKMYVLIDLNCIYCHWLRMVYFTFPSKSASIFNGSCRSRCQFECRVVVVDSCIYLHNRR